MQSIWRNPARSICNVVVSTLLLTLLPVTGSAVEFVVNSTVDAVDSNPGNGLCETVVSAQVDVSSYTPVKV